MDAKVFEILCVRGGRGARQAPEFWQFELEQPVDRQQRKKPNLTPRIRIGPRLFPVNHFVSVDAFDPFQSSVLQTNLVCSFRPLGVESRFN